MKSGNFETYYLNWTPIFSSDLVLLFLLSRGIFHIIYKINMNAERHIFHIKQLFIAS